MPKMPGVPYNGLPLHYAKGGPSKLWIVLHCTAGSEELTAAEDGHQYDMRRSDSVSCHVFADGDSLAGELDTSDRAYAARTTGNEYGIHIEIAGTYQTRAQWLDAKSRPGIYNAARYAAWAMQEHGIPLVRLTTAELRAHRKGFTDHAGITTAFAGTHMDPGPEFPWDVFLDDVRSIQQGVDMKVDPFIIDSDVAAITGYKVGEEVPFERVVEVILARAHNASKDSHTAVAKVDELTKTVNILVTAVTDLANRPVTGATAAEIVAEMLAQIRKTPA